MRVKRALGFLRGGPCLGERSDTTGSDSRLPLAPQVGVASNVHLVRTLVHVIHRSSTFARAGRSQRVEICSGRLYGTEEVLCTSLQSILSLHAAEHLG